MRWLTLLAAGLLAACATSNDPNPWDDLEVETEPAPRPVALPDWPSPIHYDADTVTFDLEGAKRLERFRVVSVGNYDMAEASADEVDALNDAAGHLIEAGKAQRALTDLQRQIVEEERRRHFFEKITYWAGFAIIIAAASL